MAGNEGAYRIVRIERCTDARLINSIITHPKVYRWGADDGAQKPEEFDCSGVIGVDGVYFLTPVENQVLGCFLVHRHTAAMYEIHVSLLPECWGRAVEAARLCREWVFSNTGCRKLIAWVPVNNRLAYRLAVKSGMKVEGLCKKSYLKNGVLWDMHLLGLEK